MLFIVNSIRQITQMFFDDGFNRLDCIIKRKKICSCTLVSEFLKEFLELATSLSRDLSMSIPDKAGVMPVCLVTPSDLSSLGVVKDRSVESEVEPGDLVTSK